VADLSGLIYSAALSNPLQQPGDAADRPARRPSSPWQAGTAARLAPLVSIIALSLGTIVLCAHPSRATVPVTAHPAHLNNATALRVRPAEHSVALIGRTVQVRAPGSVVGRQRPIW
jgi:hypothetical protein